MDSRTSRQGWPVLAYKFWIQPARIPQQVWDTARETHSLWNQLVELTNTTYGQLKTREPGLSKEERAAIYADLDRNQRRLVAESKLNWEGREFIFERFNAAMERWVRSAAKTGSFSEGGFPKKRTRLDKIAIRHRYSHGGVPLSRLLRPRPRKSVWRFWLRPVPYHAYSHPGRAHKRLCYSEGFFGIDGVRIPFRAMIHRRVPAEAIIKNVILIGRHSRQFSWEWAFALVCVTPPRPASTPRTGRFCGLDLGWRKFDTYLRIGMLVDNAGNVIELRLPLSTSNRRARDFNSWIELAGHPRAKRIYETWEEIQEATAAAEKSMEMVKAQVAAMGESLEFPEEIRNHISQVTEMRQRGLVHLLRALQEARIGQDLQDLIMTWKVLEDKARRRIHSARVRFARKRHWLYQNLAAWMAENYDVISWEEELDIKEMLQKRGRAEALERADRYRQIAAIGEFRAILRRQVTKHHSVLMDGLAAYSTIRCFTCGAQTEGSAELRLQCPEGHTFDQDENAARWFLSEVSRDVLSEFILRKEPVSQEQRIEIPTVLHSVLVPRFQLRSVTTLETWADHAVRGQPDQRDQQNGLRNIPTIPREE
ncbi:MAG: hypothetical protein HY650_03560 [Acidobacteria bacterium]|nr:hypothetical protein [Acidobacteriota bacterium]